MGSNTALLLFYTAVLSHIVKTSQVEVIVVSGLTATARAKPTVHHTFPLRGLDTFPLSITLVLMAVIVWTNCWICTAIKPLYTNATNTKVPIISLGVFSGGACAAAVEEGDRNPPRWPTAHPERNHRDPFLWRPAQGRDQDPHQNSLKQD